MVGTAHLNRNGELVDYRPSTMLAEMNISRDGTATLTLAPPKGVEIEALVLPANCTHAEMLEDEVCYTRIKETWHAEYESVSLSVTREVTEDKDTPEAEAVRAELRAEKDAREQAELAARAKATAERRAQRAAQELSERIVEERICRTTPAELLNLCKPTAGEWGKLGSSNWQRVLSELVIRARWALAKPTQEVELSPTRLRVDEAWLTAMRQSLLAIRAEEQAKRKAEYLARQ